VLNRSFLLLLILFGAAGVVQADSNVVVFPFDNLSNDRTLDWIGEGISELIIQRLRPEPGVYVIAREERLAAYETFGIPDTSVISHATALKVGWGSGADQIVIGNFSANGGKFQMIARLVDLQAETAVAINLEGQLEDVIPLTMNTSWQLLKKLVPGTSSPESDYTARPPIPRSAFESYIRGILNQDLQKRIDLLQTAVRLHPHYGPAQLQLGRAYQLQGDFEISNEWLQKISDSPDLRQAQFMMALNYFYLDQHTRAITTLQGLPQTYDVLLNLGSAFSRSGDPASAIAVWKRAIGIDPLGSDAFFNIGYVSFVNGDLETASKNLNESLRLRGRDSEALLLLGRTYEQQSRFEESQKLISQAIRLSQRVQRWLSQPPTRIERFVTTTTFRSHDEIWNDKRLVRRGRRQDLNGWLEVIQGDIDSYLFGDALRELHDIMRIYPDSSEARSLLNEVDRQQSLR